MKLILKVFRYLLLYGIRRTLVKTLYMANSGYCSPLLKWLMYAAPSSERICVIGLGNHGFTLISFFVCVYGRKRISLVVDPSERAKRLALSVLQAKHFNSVDEAIAAGEFYGSVVYIASDHASHSEHLIRSVDRFDKIFVEKPLFVNQSQAVDFQKILEDNADIYTGFNRPLAPMTSFLREELVDDFSVSMVVNGHYLDDAHWYREDRQGTRVLGNLTHWLDLSLRLFCANNDNGILRINVWKGTRDDLSVCLTFDRKKVDIIFSANCEPPDGVEEFIFWNSSKSVGRILNFKSITFTRGNQTRFSKNELMKNVGHKSAILAPLLGLPSEVHLAYLSSVLALKVEEMYISDVSSSEFEINF